MAGDSFGPILQEMNKTILITSKYTGNVSLKDEINRRNSENMNGGGIEKTLHQLLTQANDHFGESEDIPSNHHHHDNNNNNNNSTNNNTNNNTTNSIHTTNTKHDSVDFETAIEHAISYMRTNSVLDTDIKRLGEGTTNDTTDSSTNDISGGSTTNTSDHKPFTLDNILGEEHNPTMTFELDELDFNPSSKDINKSNNIDTTESPGNKRHFDEIDVHFAEFEKLTKSAKIQSTKTIEEPFLSPASLSPMSSDNNGTTNNANNEIKTDDTPLITPPIIVPPIIPKKNITTGKTTDKKNTPTHILKTPNQSLDTKENNAPKKSNNNKHDNTTKTSVEPVNTTTTNNNNNNNNNAKSKPIYYQQPIIPEKLTNQYTIHQVSEMKKRMINTHKLMLNFNFLKDSYAKTCVELKKSLNALKDSEIHRAHLLLENEQLKAKLHELELAKK